MRVQLARQLCHELNDPAEFTDSGQGSPIIFDAAHIAPATSGPYSGTRYGVGGGVRFTLASTVSVTAGYSWNANRRPGEDPGAFSVSLTTRNLFH